MSLAVSLGKSFTSILSTARITELILIATVTVTFVKSVESYYKSLLIGDCYHRHHCCTRSRYTDVITLKDCKITLPCEKENRLKRKRIFILSIFRIAGRTSWNTRIYIYWSYNKDWLSEHTYPREDRCIPFPFDAFVTVETVSLSGKLI